MREAPTEPVGAQTQPTAHSSAPPSRPTCAVVSHTRKVWCKEVLLPTTVALLLRLALVACVNVVPRWDGVIYTRAAVDIAEGRGFTRAIFTPGDDQALTAFYPVGFPAWLAGLRLLHIEGRGALALQALLGALVVPIAWSLARRLHNARSARYAAWLAALWPGGAIYALSYFAEPLFAIFLGIATLAAIGSKERGWLHAAFFAGLAIGGAAWVRPTAIAMAFAIGAACGRTWRERISAALVTSVVALAVVAPWMARNATFLGGPALSTNGSYNLLLGTYGLGGYEDLPAGADCDITLHAIHLDACRTERALERIQADPIDWVRRGLHKLADTFAHESTPGLYLKYAIDGASHRDREWAWAIATTLSAPFWGALILLACGALLMNRCAKEPLIIVLAPIVALAGVHFVYIGGDRYHVAVAPMILALAGVMLASIHTALETKKKVEVAK